MTTKLDINPFTPGIPVPAELFAGRTQQIQQVRNYLNQTASGRLENLFLTGDRGIGKSSFASIIRRIAEDEHDITSVHLHLGSVNTIDELVRRIFEELAKAGAGELDARDALDNVAARWDAVLQEPDIQAFYNE